MPDPVTTLGAGALAAYLGKDGLQKLLGPTADYLGGEFREFTKKRIENVGKIFRNAEDKLGDNIEAPGQVSPKVLKTIINEGSYCDDSISVEYFGGILASSRTDIERDDRGARVAKILDGMSAYQIRSHYIIYSLIKKVFSNSGYLYIREDRPRMRLFIPMKIYIAAMSFNQKEGSNFSNILTHSLFGLNSDNLIGDFQFGPKESILESFNGASDDGIIVEPSALGAELYLWGYGEGNQELAYALKADVLADLSEIPLNLEGVEKAHPDHKPVTIDQDVSADSPA